MAKLDTLHVVENVSLVSLVERLFGAEEGLRSAAIMYERWEHAVPPTADLLKNRNSARARLREAALKYAEIAKLVSP
jgi:hypothetical protein